MSHSQSLPRKSLKTLRYPIPVDRQLHGPLRVVSRWASAAFRDWSRAKVRASSHIFGF